MRRSKPAIGKMVHGLPTDQNILAFLGTIALRHGQLDNALRMTIKELLGVTRTVALDATARDGSRKLRERIRKLAQHRLGEGKALVHLQAILKRCERVTEERNKLMHEVWGIELDHGPMIRGDDDELRPIPSITKLKKLDHEIIKILNDLIEARNGGFLSEALKKLSP